MTVATPGPNLGRHVFGVAALGYGVITLIWHDYHNWDQLRYILNATDGPVIVYAAAATQIFGGAAIQFCRTAKTGAVVLGTVYLVFALLCVPRIAATPQIYDRWGNFFEQFALVTGASIVYARSSSARAPETLDRIGRLFIAICVAYFSLEQAIYLDATATLVPKWLPLGQTFWAIATTVLFALAAAALLANRLALLTSRLLTMMLVVFGLLVWIPLLVSDPYNYENWSETIETFAIAGAALILADLLGDHRRNEGRGFRNELLPPRP